MGVLHAGHCGFTIVGQTFVMIFARFAIRFLRTLFCLEVTVLRLNASVKRVNVEISTIADPEISEFYNSENISTIGPKMLFTRGEEWG